uniref:Fatty acid desaturase domain-containing protein n=1 Tax=Aureoumbra lagunensis TaxID=44058 RepID=A0A7S3K4M0_9STRA|mmetsp:Transcript_9891/g.12414  ORF Transcript_9891/g.12414 Transcript_9891/m.12414 type:complete len:407 (-) Transcript_9891:322-1542(-)
MCRGPPKVPLTTSSREILVASLVKDELPSKKEIRDSIPQKCFEHSLFQAFGHVVRDGLVIATFAFLAHTFLRVYNMRWFDIFGWILYAFFQGSAFTGWWVLAHECGHGGFSASTLINDIVGWTLHSALLVPYFSWQYSHAKHHSKTNHLMDGESHNPNSKADVHEAGYVGLAKIIGEETFAGFQLITHLLLGWPLYLIINATGGRRLYNGKPITSNLDHFRPSSQLFPPAWRFRIFLSSLGIALALTAIFFAMFTFGARPVALHYWFPYLVTNGWLVLYTWLQHTSEHVPHYGDSEWTWVRGALCTIDRPYAELGGFFDWMHHHIGSTHVCHHLFSNLPCYNAVEATMHLRAYLEPKGLYNYDGRSTLHAMWQTAKNCHYVDGTEGTQYVKSIFTLVNETNAKKDS